MTRKRIITATLVALLAALPLTAFGTEIVFDPTNYAKAVEQLQQDFQMVTQLRTQIQNQLKMLQNWGFSQLDSILGSMNRWQGVLDESREVYSTKAPEVQLQTQFPDAPAFYIEKSDAQMDQIRQGWTDRGREALVGHDAGVAAAVRRRRAAAPVTGRHHREDHQQFHEGHATTL